ncbi:GGDEF domain-containing protein [Acinetobacter lanii]|uniref:diguanylate cyclase n=1 Tax=Acinetobacter lanii TaxID=2715163 RepID=A0A6G8S691_9GAMM|nr:GGDEF domain-containing protein [Acinetobacter lanii]QIO09558.1 GGDEF domain-containing protein [Acinetobacter lanii]
MKHFIPDFLTAFSMSAMTAFIVSWLMWMLGQPYWRQGLGLALLSTLSYALAYGSYSLYQVLSGLSWLVASKLFMSLAVGLFTVALQVFRHNHHFKRDLMTVVLPLLSICGCAGLFLTEHVGKFSQWQSTVVFIQTLYCIRILLQMRSRTPGSGWRYVTLGMLIQLAGLVPLLSTRQTSIEISSLSTSNLILVLWLVCLVLVLKLLLVSFGFMLMLRDRTGALQQGQAKLDYLTQLPTRSALIQGLQHATIQASSETVPLTLMIIDIDHFDQLNREHGHLAGDQVIQHVAKTLEQQCRATDLAVRYCAAQFVLLLPNTTIQGAEVLAQRLCDTVRSQPFTLINNSPISITVSIGVHCCIPAADSPWQSLMAGAKAALFSAKQQDGNGFVLSTPSMLNSTR